MNVERLIYKLTVWEKILICEERNEREKKKNILLESWKEKWNSGVGSFVGSRRVCFVDTRLCEWKGRKRMRKHSNPEKQFKTVFHHLDIQHNLHAVLFTAKIFIFESNTTIFNDQRNTLFYKFMHENFEYISNISSKTNISNIFEYFELEIA